MAMVPNQAIVTYIGHWPRPFVSASAATYVGRVAANLTASGLAVRKSRYESSFLFGDVPIGGMDVELTIQVQNGLGYGDPNDIISIVRSWVYKEAGAFPTADSIPVVQVPNQPGQPTGQPTGDVDKPKSPTFFDMDFGGWFEELTQKGMFAIGLLVIGILAALLLIATARGRA